MSYEEALESLSRTHEMAEQRLQDRLSLREELEKRRSNPAWTEEDEEGEEKPDSFCDPEDVDAVQVAVSASRLMHFPPPDYAGFRIEGWAVAEWKDAPESLIILLANLVSRGKVSLMIHRGEVCLQIEGGMSQIFKDAQK